MIGAERHIANQIEGSSAIYSLKTGTKHETRFEIAWTYAIETEI